MGAAIYARTAVQNESRLAEQEARCRAYAAAQDREVAGVWRDVGSGLAAKRPGLAALRVAVRDGTVDTVIVTDAARLSRAPGTLADLLAEAESAGAMVALIDEGPGRDATGSVLAADILGAAWGRVGGGASARSRRPSRRR